MSKNNLLSEMQSWIEWSETSQELLPLLTAKVQIHLGLI